MNEPQDDKLDRLLRDWAARHQPELRTLEEHRESIWRAWEDERDNSAEKTTAAVAKLDSANRLRWYSWGAAAALIAASVLAIALPGLFSRNDREIVTPSQTQPLKIGEAPAAITAEQMARKAELFAELERLFGSQLSWVAETNGTVEIGVEPTATSVATGEVSTPIAIRITVMRKAVQEREWTAIWTVDLVSRSERLVQFRPDAVDSPRLLVWAYLLPDGKIACDSELSLDGAHGLHALASELQAAGSVTEVALPERDDVEYRIFKTVALPCDEVI